MPVKPKPGDGILDEKFAHIKVMITGGGTGGHIFPALAVMEMLQQKGFRHFIYVGGTKGLENSIIPGKGIPFHRLWISGVERGSLMKNILFPLKLVTSFFQANYLLLKYRPHVVLGFGGYVSGPVIFSASSMLIPTMIMEQDVYPGITTRILARWAKRILIAFEESRSYFSVKQQFKIVTSGNPVRPSLVKWDSAEAKKRLGLDPGKFTVAVLGGSQGARAINQVMERNLNRIKDLGIQLVWQTGKLDYPTIAAKAGISQLDGLVIQPFFEEMDVVYSAADLVINRAGAISIAEMLKMQVPAILVPYPFAAGDHQRKNAETMVQRGVARMVLQTSEQFEQQLIRELENLVKNPQKLAEMKENLKKFEKNEALDIYYHELTQLMIKHGIIQ